MKNLQRLQEINKTLIRRIEFLSINVKKNIKEIEIFEDRKFSIQKAMFKR